MGRFGVAFGGHGTSTIINPFRVYRFLSLQSINFKDPEPQNRPCRCTLLQSSVLLSTMIGADEFGAERVLLQLLLLLLKGSAAWPPRGDNYKHKACPGPECGSVFGRGVTDGRNNCQSIEPIGKGTPREFSIGFSIGASRTIIMSPRCGQHKVARRARRGPSKVRTVLNSEANH